jgi:hypothetical protein
LPAGEPVSTMSPGRSSDTVEMCSISSATSKSMSAVVSSCIVRPLTRSVTRRSIGSST